MRVMNVLIDQQFSRLGLNVTEPRADLNITPPKTEVKKPDPKVMVKTKNSDFKVDSTRCRQAIDLYTPKALGQKTAKEGMQKLGKWVQKIAREGDALARIEANKNMIPRLAKNTFVSHKEISLTTKPGPTVKYVKGSLKMHWDLKPVNVNLNYGDVQTKGYWGKVEAYHEQQAYIDINYDGRLIDFLK